MDIQIAGKTYALGKIKATRENLKKLFNIAGNWGSIDAQMDFLDMLETSLGDNAKEALDSLELTDIGQEDSDYGRAYNALITMAFGKAEAKPKDGKA